MAIDANVKDIIDPLAKKKWTNNKKKWMPMTAETGIAMGILRIKLTMKHSAYHRT
jgi:hypothetical protein